MSLHAVPRLALVGLIVLVATSPLGACSHGRLHVSAAEPSASNDGSKSDGSKSDGSKSDGTQSEGSKSDGSSDGSSDSKSETSGTATTGKKEAETNVGLYILTGALLLGATTIVGLVLIAEAEPVAYTTRHERGIRLALTRGEGPFIRDVAENLKLPHALLPTLGMTLQRARGSLEPHLVAKDPEVGLTKEDGRRFAESLARALEAEPALTPYVKRLMDEASLVVGSRRP